MLIDRLLDKESGNHNIYEAGSNLGVLDSNIVYYLAGFLCHRFEKKIVCNDCFKATRAGEPQVEGDRSFLTDLINYGPLCHPTKSFFHSIIALELAISLNHSTTTGDILLDEISKVNFNNVTNISCSENSHMEAVVLTLFPYYITMRLHFYAKSQRNILGHGKATRNKRKESKLTS